MEERERPCGADEREPDRLRPQDVREGDRLADGEPGETLADQLRDGDADDGR